MPERHDPAIILHLIPDYCHQADSIHEGFGTDRSRFDRSFAYRNSLAMCIMQIGEMVKYLPEDFCRACRS